MKAADAWSLRLRHHYQVQRQVGQQTLADEKQQMRGYCVCDIIIKCGARLVRLQYHYQVRRRVAKVRALLISPKQ